MQKLQGSVQPRRDREHIYKSPTIVSGRNVNQTLQNQSIQSDSSSRNVELVAEHRHGRHFAPNHETFEIEESRKLSISSKNSKSRSDKFPSSFSDQGGVTKATVTKRSKRGLAASSFSKSLDIPEVDSSLEIDKYEKSTAIKENS